MVGESPESRPGLTNQRKKSQETKWHTCKQQSRTLHPSQWPLQSCQAPWAQSKIYSTHLSPREGPAEPAGRHLGARRGPCHSSPGFPLKKHRPSSAHTFACRTFPQTLTQGLWQTSSSCRTPRKSPLICFSPPAAVNSPRAELDSLQPPSHISPAL